jgi:hypothetical protein
MGVTRASLVAELKAIITEEKMEHLLRDSNMGISRTLLTYVHLGRNSLPYLFVGIAKYKAPISICPE